MDCVPNVHVTRSKIIYIGPLPCGSQAMEGVSPLDSRDWRPSAAPGKTAGFDVTQVPPLLQQNGRSRCKSFSYRRRPGGIVATIGSTISHRDSLENSGAAAIRCISGCEYNAGRCPRRSGLSYHAVRSQSALGGHSTCAKPPPERASRSFLATPLLATELVRADARESCGRGGRRWRRGTLTTVFSRWTNPACPADLDLTVGSEPR
jgi:hypothetical protein